MSIYEEAPKTLISQVVNISEINLVILLYYAKITWSPARKTGSSLQSSVHNFC